MINKYFCTYFSKDRKRAICGLKNGAVRIIPLQFGDVSEMGASWTLNVHDNHYGQITHIASSYDDNYLFTVSLKVICGIFIFIEHKITLL